jgi:hypothetical protein
LPLSCQSNSGELRLKVPDLSSPDGETTVRISSEVNQFRKTPATNDQGNLNVPRLPHEISQLEITQSSFVALFESVEIGSSIPIKFSIQLKLPSVNQSVSVELEDSGSVGALEPIGFSQTVPSQGYRLLWECPSSDF